MTIGTEFSTLLKSKLASSIYNIDSKRVGHASLHEGKEGWTEIWGNLEEKDDDNKKEEEEDYWAMEDAAVQRMKEAQTPFPSIPLTLTQYRIAWYEQLILRICHIPHVVLNSSYLSMESTGSLPYLMHIPPPAADSSSKDKKDLAALVGRNHPGAADAMNDGDPKEGGRKETKVKLHSNSHIIDYLHQSSSSYSKLLSQHFCLNEAITKEDELAYQSLIQYKLQPILSSLRYKDMNAWEQIYRQQCIEATINPNGLGEGEDDDYNGEKKKKKKQQFFNMFAWYQAWSERIINVSQLVLSHYDNHSETFLTDEDIQKAMKQARQIYQSMEAKLQQSGSGAGNDTHYYLFNTTKPTLVDVYFFAHLCEALCNVHLVLVLSEFPNILKFFQQFYEGYFGKDYISKKEKEGGGEKGSSSDNNDWIEWNNKMNSVNQFNRIPMGGRVTTSWRSNFGTGGGGSGKKKYQDALQMMQSLALHCHDLREALSDVALQRREEQEEAEALSTAATNAAAAAAKANGKENVVFTKRAAGWMFHRMRMNGDLYAELKKEKSDAKKEKMTTASGGADQEESKRREEEEDEITKKNRAHMEKMRRDNKKNDELWMSSVVIGSILAFVFAAAKSSAQAASK